MKNKEMSAKEIVESAIANDRFGVDRRTNKARSCSDLLCKDCLLNTGFKHGRTCYESRREWAEAEYVEPKVFTREEKAIISLLDKVKWIARDSTGVICGYTSENQ